MSASIRYERVSMSRGKCLSLMAPQAFIGMLEEAFGRFPLEIGPGDLSTLRGMAAALRGKDDGKAIERLIEVIGDDETVMVWAEY